MRGNQPAWLIGVNESAAERKRGREALTVLTPLSAGGGGIYFSPEPGCLLPAFG